MVNIENIRQYYKLDQVYTTEHAAERYRQRGIKAKDVRYAVDNGRIIEQYPDDFPYPSCLILGKDINNNPLHVCVSDEGTSSKIITAYYPNQEKWCEGFSRRKETSYEKSSMN